MALSWLFVMTRTNVMTLVMLSCYHSTTYFWECVLFRKKSFVMCYFSFETSLFVWLSGLQRPAYLSLFKRIPVYLCYMICLKRCGMLGMWYAREVALLWRCWGCGGILGMWDVEDLGCWGFGMLGRWGWSRCEMFGTWNIWDVGCLGRGMFGMWNVRYIGCLDCGMFGMWDVWRDVGFLFTKCFFTIQEELFQEPVSEYCFLFSMNLSIHRFFIVAPKMLTGLVNLFENALTRNVANAKEVLVLLTIFVASCIIKNQTI